jgi:hypothetical protein
LYLVSREIGNDERLGKREVAEINGGLDTERMQ